MSFGHCGADASTRNAILQSENVSSLEKDINKPQQQSTPAKTLATGLLLFGKMKRTRAGIYVSAMKQTNDKLNINSWTLELSGNAGERDLFETKMDR